MPVMSADDRKMSRGPALIEGTIHPGATESERLIDCVTLRGDGLKKQEMETEGDVEWRPLVLLITVFQS